MIYAVPMYHVRRATADRPAHVFCYAPGREVPNVPDDFTEVDGFELMTKAELDAYMASRPQEVPEAITRRQFLKALLVNFAMTEADVEALIDQLPAGQVREIARIDFRHAAEFRRQHPTVIALATLAGKNAAQLDDLFRYGATLE